MIERYDRVKVRGEDERLRGEERELGHGFLQRRASKRTTYAGVICFRSGEEETGQSRTLTWCHSRHCRIQGSVKDSVVYFLAVLNTRQTPLHWRNVHNNTLKEIQNETEDKREYSLKNLLPKRRTLPVASTVHYVEGVAREVQSALYSTLSEFKGDLEDENQLEILIEQQFEALQKALKISNKATEARMMVFES
ncbi:hypothetical protein L1887_34409 [Cichorium endivia]|nr:hypothetical protein L1887_34409 [Cichorium endivia]